MQKQALMIKTGDRRRFFTHKKNLQTLAEFAKTFGATVTLVTIEEPSVLLELDNLAPAICDANYATPKQSFEIIEQIWPKVESRRERSDLLQNANEIRNFIRSQLLKDKELSLKDLKKRYEKMNLTDSCLCSHFSAIRKQLAQAGHTVDRVGKGIYRITKKDQS